jgi:multiple sugar transport system substrate-binding protein
VIAYNKKHLKEIGLTELPKTWDELGAVARQLSANGHVGYGLGLSQGSQGLSLMDWFYPVFWSFGGEMEDANGKATFNSPAGVKTMQILYDLVYKYNAISQDILESDTDAVLQAFQAGRVSMYTMGTHRFTTAQHVLNADGSDSVGWAPIPSDNPDKPSPARIGFWSMVIPKGSKNPDLAWEFIVNYISPQSNTVNAKLAGEMPARNSVYNDPWFSTDPLGKEMVRWKEYINNHGRMPIDPPDYLRLYDILCNAAQRIVFQREPIQATLDAAAREYDMK